MNITSDQIRAELARIEREHGVRVLYAAESGSRAWGFASRDSGHDVRYLYMRASDRRPVDQPDVIEQSVSSNLEISGSDVRGAQRLLAQSNPSLFEWIKSPIVYRADPAFALLFGLLATEYHSPARNFRHYLDAAKMSAALHLQDSLVELKHYLGVLRTLLACRWIERGLGPVPMRFETLVDTLVDEANLRVHIAVLVARKRAGREDDRAQQIPLIRAFIADELARLEQIVPVDSITRKPGEVDLFLREFCFEEAA